MDGDFLVGLVENRLDGRSLVVPVVVVGDDLVLAWILMCSPAQVPERIRGD